MQKFVDIKLGKLSKLKDEGENGNGKEKLKNNNN